MSQLRSIDYEIKTQFDLNLSYMPFIKDGGLFIPIMEFFALEEHIMVNIIFPGQKDAQQVEGKVIWITPENALYQIYRGVGIQFIGSNAKSIHELVKANLDNTIDVGGYTYGMPAGVTDI
jgi:type IV pilus assembly protein PilZ